MRKIGYNVLERKMKEHPPTPAEVREMAKYYGVNLYEEWGIVPFVKLTVNAPLPPEWEEYEEDDGSNCYVHLKTGNKSSKVRHCPVSCTHTLTHTHTHTHTHTLFLSGDCC